MQHRIGNLLTSQKMCVKEDELPADVSKVPWILSNICFRKVGIMIIH
jgi:hypothetical protein